jgi:hypothetical protein
MNETLLRSVRLWFSFNQGGVEFHRGDHDIQVHGKKKKKEEEKGLQNTLQNTKEICFSESGWGISQAVVSLSRHPSKLLHSAIDGVRQVRSRCAGPSAVRRTE